MKGKLFTYAVEALYLAAGSYWVWRALAEYEPLRAALRGVRDDLEDQARYRAAVQRTLAAIRRLPETGDGGHDSVSRGTDGPGAVQ